MERIYLDCGGGKVSFYFSDSHFCHHKIIGTSNLRREGFILGSEFEARRMVLQEAEQVCYELALSSLVCSVWDPNPWTDVLRVWLPTSVNPN